MPAFNKKSLKAQKISDNQVRKVVHLDNLMLVAIEFSNGPASEPDKPHSHPHEQITYVEEGELYFFLDGVKHLLEKGDIVTIPSGTEHCIQILSPSVKLIDCFSPVREDFIKPA